MATRAALQQDHQEVLKRFLNTKLQEGFEPPPLAPVNADGEDHAEGADAEDQTDLADSLGALDLAAKGIAALGANLKQVNDLAEQRAAWFDAEAARLKGELEEHEREAAEWRERADALEAKLAAAMRRAEAAEERSVQAEASLDLLKARILLLLGVESNAGRIVAELRAEDVRS